MVRIRTDARQHAVGVISDTHGVLRPSVVKALNGVEHIVHAGDIGNPEILEKLGRIAPVTAVKGNTDYREWAVGLPSTEIFEIGQASIYVLHDLDRLDLDPAAADIQVVISGHTHRQMIEKKNGVVYLNPGSAGPQRHPGWPVSIAIMSIQKSEGNSGAIEIENEFIYLDEP